MAITQVDKVKIHKYLKDHALGDIYYMEMCDALGKRDKISDIEFLQYFTDYVVNEFRKNISISIKHLTKVISTIERFLEWIYVEHSEIREDILDKIRNFENFYDEYLNRTGFDIDLDFVDNCIGSVLKTVNKLYSYKEKNVEEQNGTLAKYLNKIVELEETIKELRQNLTNLTRLYDNLKISYIQKSDKIQSLNDEKIGFDKELKIKNQEIVRLTEMVKSLENKIRELENSLFQLGEEKTILMPYKEQCDLLSLEVEKLKETVDKETKIKNAEADLRIRETELEALIYQKLLLGDSSVEEILKYIKKEGIISDRNEIVSLLRKIKTKINIDNNFFAKGPVYKLSAPNILENGQFSINIPDGCKVYDIMLVSDFHLRDFNSEVLTRFDMLNDYCVNNGIHFILNLGDFFDGISGRGVSYDNAVKNYKVIEEAIKMIPRAEGLYHAVLGGNHDKKFTMYGFDPIRILSDEREDFIHLGYTHSTINLNGSYKQLGKFDIHHPNNFDFPISVDEDGIDLIKLNSYLGNVYNAQSRNRDDSCIDIFGHTHRSQFNCLSSCCYIPPFLDRKEKSGAWHLSFYFDGNDRIKYMQFKQLNISSRLFKSNEIIYKKVLSK